MGQISVSLHIMRDNDKIVEVSDHVPVREILPHLLKLASDQSVSSALPENCLLLIGRPVAFLEGTLAELGVRSGDILSIVQLHIRAASTSLLLASPRGSHPPFQIDHSPATLGRSEKNDVDVSPILGAGREKTVSRQQARFFEENGTWHVRLHENASAPMFVDNQRVTTERPVALLDNDVISFGPSPNRPNLQLVVRFQSEVSGDNPTGPIRIQGNTPLPG
jgi:hypothetical protein